LTRWSSLAEASYADSLRLAGACRNDLAATDRCRARAIAMLRQMRGLLRNYERRQAERGKALAAMHPAAMERAGWWFREASVPQPEPAQTAPPDPAVAPNPDRNEDRFSRLTEGEQYAVIHPARAASIRAHGGLPPNLDYGPPEPHIVEELVHGTSPILLALDQHARAPAVPA